MDSREIAKRIRAAAKQIPPGGTISVRGDTPISAFNFAEAVARIVEDAACERALYRRLCDQPEQHKRVWTGPGELERTGYIESDPQENPPC